jgi:hypothetical protein
MKGDSMRAPHRGLGFFAWTLFAFLCLLPMPGARASDDTWAGRWRGPLVITTGPGAGSTLRCEFLMTDQETSFAGTVSCPRFGPVDFMGSEGARVEGAAWGGIYFGGYRQGNSASGTWAYPERGNSGTWSATRAGAP